MIRGSSSRDPVTDGPTDRHFFRGIFSAHWSTPRGEQGAPSNPADERPLQSQTISDNTGDLWHFWNVKTAKGATVSLVAHVNFATDARPDPARGPALQLHCVSCSSLKQ